MNALRNCIRRLRQVIRQIDMSRGQIEMNLLLIIWNMCQFGLILSIELTSEMHEIRNGNGETLTSNLQSAQY